MIDEDEDERCDLCEVLVVPGGLVAGLCVDCRHPR